MDDAELDTSYAHRPKPFGQEARFELLPDRLKVEHGRRKGNFLYRDIVRMRLAYAPTNIASDGFETKLFTRQGKTVRFTNLSWRSMAEMERHNDAYRAFAKQLAARIAEAGPATFEAGVGRFRYQAMLILAALSFVLLGAVVAYGIYRTLVPEAAVPDRLPGLLGMMAAATILYMGFWMARYFRRNQPRQIDPRALPDEILPKAGVGQRLATL